MPTEKIVYSETHGDTEIQFLAGGRVRLTSRLNDDPPLSSTGKTRLALSTGRIKLGGEKVGWGASIMVTAPKELA